MPSLAKAVSDAVRVGRARGERAAVAVYDRRAKRYYTAGDADNYYASASVMKVFIAARLLVDGQADDPEFRALMRRMIVVSDDRVTRELYPVAGGAAVASWVGERYHLDGIAPTPNANLWGLTRVTARALAKFYDVVAADPKVGPWLLDALGHTEATAADGFHQLYGIPAVSGDRRVKQGWMCCLDDRTRTHSTGYVNADRYTVALMTEGSTAIYGDYARATLTLMAKALLPGGPIPTG